MPKNGFSLTRIFQYKDRVLTLYGKIRVIENPYSVIFDTVRRFAKRFVDEGSTEKIP